jgi:uncharacterized cupin superfamily protein
MTSEISVEREPSLSKLNVMGVFDWAILDKDTGTFNWKYDRKETCYILEGSFSVTPQAGKTQHFKKGDLISFSKGLECIWIVTKPVKKHYHLW